jgi:hypothetical protein
VENEVKLSHIFKAMNKLVADAIIADFSVTRSSLEQVFIHFAKYQRMGVVPVPGVITE